MKRYVETPSSHTFQHLSAVLMLVIALAATGCDMIDSNAVEDDAPAIEASQGLYKDIHPLGPPVEAPGDDTTVLGPPEEEPGDEPTVLGPPEEAPGDEPTLHGPPVEAPGAQGPHANSIKMIEETHLLGPPVEAPAENLLGLWEFAEGRMTAGKKRWLPLVTFKANGRVLLETECAIYKGSFSSTRHGGLTISALEMKRELCNTLVEDPLVAALQAATAYKTTEAQLFIAYSGGELVFNNSISPAQY